MKKDYPPEQQPVVELLNKLRESEADYPPEMLSATRAVFQRKVSTVRAQMTTSAGAATSPSGAIPARWRAIFQIAVITVIIGTLATGIYLLRDQWLGLFIPGTPTTVHPAPANKVITPGTPPFVSKTMIPATPSLTPFVPATLIQNGSTITISPTGQTPTNPAAQAVMTSPDQPQTTNQTPTALAPTVIPQPTQPTNPISATAPSATTQPTQPANQTFTKPAPTVTAEPEQPPSLTPRPSPTVTTNPGLHLGQTPGTPAAPGHQTPRP